MHAVLPFLVVSASGRALAASACKAGLPVVVLDLFNDMDTRVLAVASARCAGANGGFSARAVLTQARALSPSQGYAGIVVGSGFEGRLRLHTQLAQRARLIGNTPESVARSKDPALFFTLLDELGIAHPDVCLHMPANPDGWLSKRVGAAGGAHVRDAIVVSRRREQRYFQRRVEGTPMSALFLADGKRAGILGCNRLLSRRLSRAQPYAFAGAVTSEEDVALLAQIRPIVQRLTHALGLRGLNGLDFIRTHEGPRVLELNPRPTASLELHDDRVASGLFGAHLLACDGTLPMIDTSSAAPHRALAVVWTSRCVRVPTVMHWPDWAADIPAPGSIIAARRPLCTVRASAASSSAAERLVLERGNAVLARVSAASS